MSLPPPPAAVVFWALYRVPAESKWSQLRREGMAMQQVDTQDKAGKRVQPGWGGETLQLTKSSLRSGDLWR